MPRGYKSKVGDENIAANGYHYVRTETGWRLKHHILAEEFLGRPLEVGERVTFKDGNRDNFNKDNINVQSTKMSKMDRIAYLRTKIRVLSEELEELESL